MTHFRLTKLLVKMVQDMVYGSVTDEDNYAMMIQESMPIGKDDTWWSNQAVEIYSSLLIELHS